MSRAWLLGLLGVLMVVVPVILYAADGEKADRPGRADRPEGDRPRGERPPELTLTPAQQEALKDQVAALEKAIADLRTKAVEVLGEREGRMFTMQSMMKAMRPAGEGPRPEGKGALKPEREGRKQKGAEGGAEK